MTIIFNIVKPTTPSAKVIEMKQPARELNLVKKESGKVVSKTKGQSKKVG